MPQTAQRKTIENCLLSFLKSTGRSMDGVSPNDNLIIDLGLTSDEGIDFVLELCDAMMFSFPESFNPFVHSDGTKGRTVTEMVDAVVNVLSRGG